MQSATGKTQVYSATLKKPGGKILDSVETVSVSGDLEEIGDMQEVAFSGSDPIPSETVQPSLLPSSTFKLDLNASEEEARSQVVLPYLRCLSFEIIHQKIF